MVEKNLDKINMEIAIKKVYEVFLLMYTVLMILHKTFLEYHLQSLFSKADCVIGAVLAILLGIRLITADRDVRNKWFKYNIVVFIYFIIRTLTLIKTGFDYSTIRCIFFEGVYLLVLTDILLSGRFVKKVLIPTTIITILFFNILNVILYFYYYNVMLIGGGNETIYYLITTYTSFHMGTIYSLVYINPNWLGMLTSLTIVLAAVLLTKDRKKAINVLLSCYIIFSIYCVYLSTCRSALTALIIVGVIWLITKVFKKISRKTVLVVCLSGIIMAMCVLGGFIVNHDSTGMLGYTKSETQLDYYSSQRYTIWKECYYADKDDIILGQGSVSRELKLRNQFFSQRYEELGYIPVNIRPHNGYIGQLVITGLLGFVLFMIVVFQKILRSPYANKGKWYLIILLIWLINIFECMFTLGINILCLYMFMVLSMADDENNEEALLEE